MKIIYIVNLIFGNWKLHGDQIVNRFKEDHNCKKIKKFYYAFFNQKHHSEKKIRQIDFYTYGNVICGSVIFG